MQGVAQWQPCHPANRVPRARSMSRRWQQPFTVVPGLGCRAGTPAETSSHCSGAFSGSKEGTRGGRQSSVQGFGQCIAGEGQGHGSAAGCCCEQA